MFNTSLFIQLTAMNTQNVQKGEDILEILDQIL